MAADNTVDDDDDDDDGDVVVVVVVALAMMNRRRRDVRSHQALTLTSTRPAASVDRRDSGRLRTLSSRRRRPMPWKAPG